VLSHCAKGFQVSRMFRQARDCPERVKWCQCRLDGASGRTWPIRARVIPDASAGFTLQLE